MRRNIELGVTKNIVTTYEIGMLQCPKLTTARPGANLATISGGLRSRRMRMEPCSVAQEAPTRF
jgi:hypothetical protein